MYKRRSKMRNYRRVKHRHPYKNDSDSDSDSDDSHKGKKDVSRIDNHIYFYGDVNDRNCLKLNQMLLECAKAMKKRKNCKCSCSCETCKPNRIFLHINSYGGDVFASLTTVDTILSSPIPVTTVVEGGAASAATLISIVGHHRQIRKHSYMLIHQGSDRISGKMEEVKDDYQNFVKIENDSNRLYLEHTKIKRSELEKILKHDIWWDARTCLNKGLVDEIL